MIYMKIFISGPMTNDPNYKEKFFKTTNYLKTKYPNATILNPAILPEGLSDIEYMSIDLTMLKCCDIIYMLKGYERSKGASLEFHYAYYSNKTIIYQEEEELNE